MLIEPLIESETETETALGMNFGTHLMYAILPHSIICGVFFQTLFEN